MASEPARRATPGAAPDVYERAKAIFLRVCEAPPAARTTIIEESCAGDEALRAEVESLLSHDDDDDDLAALDELAPGSRVGQYTILRHIGAGAMGLVYEARQERPRRTVALKVVRAGAASPSLRRRLEHEAAALARLQHPGIAAVFETGLEPSTGTPFVAMELVSGLPLTRHAADRGLSIEARVELLASICDAVQHAHLRGVIHRDLKPSNILVDESGRARVLDFGIARITAPDAAAAMRTLPGQVVGTLAYMSPEQAAGDPEALDVRADIYSLGAVAHELLSGSPPLDLAGRPLPEALRLIQQQQPPRLGQLDRRMRGDLETVVATALEKEPARRYQSAEGFAEDLRRAMRSEPIMARAPTTLYQLRRFARRRRGLVAAAGAVAASLVAAVIVSAGFAVRADIQRDRAERRFQQVRSLANTLLFDMHDLIAPLAGSTEARRRLVETGLAYLDSLAAEASDDPALLEELAEAYFRIGDIQGNLFRANLGNVDEALASYKRSIELRERIGADGSASSSLALVRGYIAVGETLSGSRAAEALEQLRLARDRLDAIRLSRPHDAEVLSTLAVAERRTGSILRSMGRPADALPHYRAALEFVEQAAGPDPAHEARRGISIALNEVGRALSAVGRHDEALPYYERSLAIRAAAAAEQPDSASARRDLALVHQGLAVARGGLGDPEAALRHNQLARDALAAIAEADPNDSRSRFDLSVAEERVAQSCASLERPHDALDHYQAALRLRVALARDNPDNLFYLKAHSIAEEQVAGALSRLGRTGEARETYRRAIALAEQCNDADPSDMRTWTVIAVAQRALGEIELSEAAGAALDSEDRRARAAAWFTECLATLERMEQAGMEPVRGDADRAEVSALLARSRAPAGGG